MNWFLVDFHGRPARTTFHEHGWWVYVPEFHVPAAELLSMLRGTHPDTLEQIAPGVYKGSPWYIGAAGDDGATYRFRYAPLAVAFAERYHPGKDFLVVTVPPFWKRIENFAFTRRMVADLTDIPSPSPRT